MYPNNAWTACIAPRGMSCANMNGAKVRGGQGLDGSAGDTPSGDFTSSTILDSFTFVSEAPFFLLIDEEDWCVVVSL